MESADGRSEPARALAWLLAGLLALVAFHAVGATYWEGFHLGLGSLHAPTPLHSVFLLNLLLLGGLAASCLAFGLARGLAAAPEPGGRADAFRRGSDALWCAAAAAVVLGLAVLLRALLLQGGPLTDDESAYQFNAELLASGRLTADSPEPRVFFDRAFMVNDGRLYGQYFLGWSALMVPAVWLGAPGFANAFYAALTVPALFGVLRRWVGSAWARGGLVLYATSPMLMVGAATQLSHPSCLCALAWATWFALRCRDADAPLWAHAGVALAFGVAFFVRPTSALGIGLPLLVYWGASALRGGGAAAVLRRAGAFALPALLLAGLFLGANHAQNGSVWETGYQAAYEYAKGEGGRFSNALDEGTDQPWLRFGESPERQLAKAATGLTRLHFDLLGWPAAFVLLLWAVGGPALPWWMLGTYALLHAPLDDLGVDTFGPLHFYEPAWPMLLLVVTGAARAQRKLSEGAPWVGEAGRLLPGTFCVASVLVALSCFVPVRLGTLARIAEDVAAPARAVEARGLEEAVVFAPRPFARSCASHPSRHFVLWRPNNSPGLEDEVLWVNDVGPEANRALMARFPGRRGYRMDWESPCELRLRPLRETGLASSPRSAGARRGATP